MKLIKLFFVHKGKRIEVYYFVTTMINLIISYHTFLIS